MLPKMQLFIFSVVVLLSVSAQPTHRREESLGRAWKEDKLKALYELVRNPLEIGTVTVVGWQYIHDDQGNVKEIRTLEVTFDTPEKKEVTSEIPLLPFDIDLETQLPYIVDRLEPDTDMLGSSQSWDIEGNLEDMLLIDGHDIWKAGDDDDVYAMRNMTVKNLDEIKSLAEDYAAASILVGNPDGSFNEKESVIRPELHAHVTSNSDCTQEMMEVALKAITDAYLKHDTIDDILNDMTKTMSKAFPEYTWILTNGHDGSYSNRDVHVSLSYTHIGLHEYPVDIDVFGIKKE